MLLDRKVLMLADCRARASGYRVVMDVEGTALRGKKKRKNVAELIQSREYNAGLV